VNESLARPFILRAVDSPKPWGGELWLTSTRPEGTAGLAIPASDRLSTLAELVAAHPEVLGEWARRLFGDEMPIFAKLIHTDFPSRVHIGFRRTVDRGELLARLEREQELMRCLFVALRVADAATFSAYQAQYSRWATEQALAGWTRDDDRTAAAGLAAYADSSFDLASWLRDVRANRAAIVDTLNDVDLRQERGNLLLSSAGIVHAIFGLSHQTHPLDRSRGALESLFADLADRARAGETDDDLRRTIDRAELSRFRAGATAPPKNEAWLPIVALGRDMLAEPQQTSDTTYSLADFYTPLTWGGERARFRKGSESHGVSAEDLSRYLADVDVSATSIASIRREPRSVAGGSRGLGRDRDGAELFCLVDEPSHWPFFTAYQVELPGESSESVPVRLRPPPGVFQQLVVTRGRVDLGDDAGRIGELSPRAPGFIPATIGGAYTLVAREPSTVLVYAVPGARGGAPVWGLTC
jgi:hypothetical protein